jgi:hypothetical protein
MCTCTGRRQAVSPSSAERWRLDLLEQHASRQVLAVEAAVVDDAQLLCESDACGWRLRQSSQVLVTVIRVVDGDTVDVQFDDRGAMQRADSWDPNRLDADRGGIARESNRAPRDLVPVVRP